MELPKKWKIEDVFHMSLLKHDSTRKWWVETAIELNEDDSEKYEVEPICNNKVYAKKSDSDYNLPGLYYLVLWKGYLEEENTWEPGSALLHFCKLISTFYNDQLERPIATSSLIDSAPPMARSIVKPRAETSSTKQKQSRPEKPSGTSKCAKKTRTSSFLSCFWPCLDSRQKIPKAI